MFSNQKYEVIKKRILDKFPQQLDTREGSYSNDLISPLTVELAKAYIAMGDILSLGFIETNFDTFLDKRVGEFGIYRKLGKKAHGQVEVEGEEGTVIDDGTIIIFDDLRFITLNQITLPSENILEVEALEVGYNYNVNKSTKFKLVEENSKIKSLIAKDNFVGGIDVESDEELRKRFIKSIQAPSTSGNKAHYEEWALECDGVKGATVFPLWNGNGTVKVMCVGDDNKPLLEDTISRVKEYIEGKMPIGCTLTVTTPTELNVTVKATVTVASGYTEEEVKQEFESALNGLIKDLTDKLVYSKVYSVLGSLKEVEDITSLTLNDATNNIPISEDKIIKIQELSVNGG